MLSLKMTNLIFKNIARCWIEAFLCDAAFYNVKPYMRQAMNSISERYWLIVLKQDATVRALTKENVLQNYRVTTLGH